MRWIRCISASDSAGVICSSACCLLAFFVLRSLVYGDGATALFLDIYSISLKGLRSSRGWANFGLGGSGRSGSAISLEFGPNEAQCSKKSRHVSSHCLKGGANGLTIGNSSLGWKRVVCDAADPLRRTGLRGVSGWNSKWSHGRGFWRKAPLLVVKVTPILGVLNSEILTVGAKKPKIIPHFLLLDVLILGVFTVWFRAQRSAVFLGNNAFTAKSDHSDMGDTAPSAIIWCWVVSFFLRILNFTQLATGAFAL